MFSADSAVMKRAKLSVGSVCALCGIHAACAVHPPAARENPATPPDRNAHTATASMGDINDGREALSLLGKPLYAPSISATRHGQLKANLEMARREYDAKPGDEQAAIWYGRRLAYLGRFREAIAVYSSALEQHPESYRLLRHRGHRHLTCRQLDAAVADLSRAWELARDKPDAPEPDGDPRPDGSLDPRSTDKSNILYHLALAHYLRGEFEQAAAVFGKRRELAATGSPLNDDIAVSFMNWEYLSLRRSGQDEAAARLLKEFRRNMDVRENDAYQALLRVYRNEVPADVLMPATDTNLSTNLAMAYGVGAYKLLNGDRTGAMELFNRLARNELWPSFGVLAAEVEVARAMKDRAERSASAER